MCSGLPASSGAVPLAAVAAACVCAPMGSAAAEFTLQDPQPQRLSQQPLQRRTQPWSLQRLSHSQQPRQLRDELPSLQVQSESWQPLQLSTQLPSLRVQI